MIPTSMLSFLTLVKFTYIWQQLPDMYVKSLNAWAITRERLGLYIICRVPVFDRNIYDVISRIHTWTRQDKPNKCLICVLLKVGSSFVEVSNESLLKRMANSFSLARSTLEHAQIRTASNGEMFVHNTNGFLGMINVCELYA